MSVEQYWMGKDLDLDDLWQDFDNGAGYAQKVAASRLHLLRLTFAEHPQRLPLFDFEVLFKTVKGTFHDVKAECLTREEYDRAAPINDPIPSRPGSIRQCTVLPSSVRADLRAHLDATARDHQRDLTQRAGRVELPGNLRAKFPNVAAGWAWRWVLPPRAPTSTVPPANGVVTTSTRR